MRIAVVIGSEAYTDPRLSALPGARKDAESLFDTLCEPSQGNHNKSKSIRLISPKLSAVRQALRDCLYNSDIKTFTFTFSGHGEVSSGSLYLLVKDTETQKLAATAFSFSELLRLIGEVQPVHTNIIIDACEAGGIVHDLNSIINPTVLGNSGTPSISVIVAASADQFAAETEAGGIVSQAVLRCISGDERVQITRPNLNLSEIGEHIAREKNGQTPVWWGLNLYGSNDFCANPHYEPEGDSHVYELASIAPTSDNGRLIQESARQLWRIFEDLSEKFSPRGFMDAIDIAKLRLPESDRSVPSFIQGLAQTLPVRARRSNDLFREPEVLAACAAALLSHVESSPNAEDSMLEILTEFLSVNRIAIEEAVDRLEDDEFSLLSKEGDLSDLFYLPLRISKLLGWIGAHLIIENMISSSEVIDFSLVHRLYKFIEKHYSGSIVAISESQAPSIYIAWNSLELRDELKLSETIMGLYINDFIHRRGRIANSELSGEKVLQFLFCRMNNNYSTAFKLLAQPTELLSVFMQWAGIANLNDTIDYHLREVDHNTLNLFIPRSYIEFGNKIIRNGQNVTFQIGGDVGLGVFSVSDFTIEFEQYCKPLIEASAGNANDTVRSAVLLSALLFPDRVPWLLSLNR